MSANLRADKTDDATLQKLTDSLVDITGADGVDVQMDDRKKVLHVNVNGMCVLRVCRIANKITWSYRHG